MAFFFLVDPPTPEATEDNAVERFAQWSVSLSGTVGG